MIAEFGNESGWGWGEHDDSSSGFSGSLLNKRKNGEEGGGRRGGERLSGVYIAS